MGGCLPIGEIKTKELRQGALDLLGSQLDQWGYIKWQESGGLSSIRQECVQ